MAGLDPAPGHVEAAADLCRYGCYWDCEHRALASHPGDALAVAGALLPVHDDDGRTLGRCRDCGGMFYTLMDHAREHERLRQLGSLASSDVLAEAGPRRRAQPRGDTPQASLPDR
jgi:hypothetical protein